MRLLLKSARCVVIGLMATTVLLATDHNFDIGPAGTDGVPSAWDSDSIDIPGGNVHLDIPLFQVSENERFGFPLVLRYDSKVWDAADSNFPNSPGSRNVIAKSIVGLGWKIHFGRVFSVSYTNPTNGTTETFYYFQGADGAMHRILLKQNIVGGSCVADAYWYAYDGSGIRAQTNASGWVVWTPDGTRYDLTRLVTGDPTITTPEQVNFKGWYVTTMTGLTPAGVSPDKQPKLTFAYAAPSDTLRRYCPNSVSDSMGRQVTFDCQPTTASGAFVDGGVIRSVTVPAPPPPDSVTSGTLTYQFDYTVQDLIDPFQCPTGVSTCTAKKANILLLSSVTASSVSPEHKFRFDYTDPEHLGANFGELNRAVLPGGAERLYRYRPYGIWRSTYPAVYSGPASLQFSLFEVRGVTRRDLVVDGQTWRWDYVRLNASNCTSSSFENCYNHPIECQVRGPYDPNNTAVGASTTVYKYNSTKASTQIPGPLDGTTESVKVYAGMIDAARLLRTTSFEYQFDTPHAGTCQADPIVFLKDHNADNVRMWRQSTSFDDDVLTLQHTTRDIKILERAIWIALTPNFGRFQEALDKKPDGSLYRKTATGIGLTSAQLANWVLTPITYVRVLNAAGAVVSETSLTYDDYGRLKTERQLYSPGGTTGSDVVVSNYYNDATSGVTNGDGMLHLTETKLASQQLGDGFVKRFTKADGYYTNILIGSEFDTNLAENLWALNISRDWGTGLPTLTRTTAFEKFWIYYDPMGRRTAIAPDSATTGGPTVTLQYNPRTIATTTGEIITTLGDVTTIAGNPLAPTSVQSKAIVDGLGRVKEERVLKFNDQGADCWVARRYTFDALGDPQAISEWAPDPTTAPVTELQRFGTYFGTTDVVMDPFGRVRKEIKPDGLFTTMEYQGLLETTTTLGIQGGTISQPSTVSSVTSRRSDTFGRLMIVTPPSDGAVVDYTYDEMDNLLEERHTGGNPTVVQLHTRKYDKLGRLTMTNDPERGKVWYGSHTLNGTTDVINPDGYDALGQVIRFQEAQGFNSSPAYHYERVYDGAARVTTVKRVAESGPSPVKTIASYVYDQADHGNDLGMYLGFPSGSHLGRLTQAKSYDDSGILLEQSDYYFKEPQFGRLNQITTSFAGFTTPYSVYYSYDTLGLVGSMTYPTAGAACTGASTCLSFSRTHGLVNGISSHSGLNPLGNVLYSDAGNVKQWQAGNGFQTQITWDPLAGSRVNQIKVLNDIGTQIWTTGTYAYDGAGNIKAIGTDAFRYDALGRVREAQVAGPTGSPLYWESYSYDTFGNMTTKWDQVGSDPPTGTQYNIDNTNNRLTQLDAGLTWTYWNNGALKRSYENGFTYDYAYDNAGRLSQVQVSGTQVGGYGYDAAGLRVKRTESHGKEIFYFRDPAGNVLSQFSRPTATTLAPAWDRDYVYLNGMRVSMIETSYPQAPSWKVTSSSTSAISLAWYPNPDLDIYGYLVLRQGPGEATFQPLYSGSLAVSTTGTSYQDTAMGTAGTAYVYKIVGVNSSGNPGPESATRPITFRDSLPPPVPSNLWATPGNAKVQLTWPAPAGVPDLAGYNLYRRTSGNYQSPLNGSVPLITANFLDMAVKNGTTYYYVVKSVDTAGLVSGSSIEVSAKPTSKLPLALNLIPASTEEGDWDSRLASLAETQDTLIPAPYATVGLTGGSKTYYFHSDHLGSVRVVSNSLYPTFATHAFLPYGEEMQPSPNSNPYRFATYERDDESGKDYAHARYYSGRVGRWTTPDPLGKGYGYVSGNPLSFFDPSGLAELRRSDGSGGGCFLASRTQVCSPDQSGRGCWPSDDTIVCTGVFGDTTVDPTPGGGGGGGGGGKTKDPCKYLDVQVSWAPINPRAAALATGILTTGNSVLVALAYGLAQSASLTAGVQVTNGGGVFGYFGASIGGDVGINQAEPSMPVVAVSRSLYGAPSTGFFYASSATLLLNTFQAGKAQDWSTRQWSDFAEKGKALSLLGASIVGGFTTEVVPNRPLSPCLGQ